MYKQYLTYMGGEIGLYKVCTGDNAWAGKRNLMELNAEFIKLKEGGTKNGVIDYVYDKQLPDSDVKFCDIIRQKCT